MRILLLGDYSNYHACLGQALAREGHEVTVASDRGGWMETTSNLDLRRKLPGRAGGALLFARMRLDSRLRGYDIVSLINPAFVQLKPSRLRAVYDSLEKHNGRIFLGAVGTDRAVMEYLTSPDCRLNYNEYLEFGKRNKANSAVLDKDMEWCRGEIGQWCGEVYERCEGVTTALYEYHLAYERIFADNPEKLRYTGIPIDFQSVRYVDHPLFRDGRLNMFLGRDRSRMAFKGTDRLEKAARRVAGEFPGKCSLTIVENLPYARYVETMRQADLVLDQLYSYTPATNALLAMATGQAVVSGGEDDYYDFIGEKSLRPVINVVPDDHKIYNTLRECVLDRDIIEKAASVGREFVSRHNDSEIVARRHLEFWQS